MKKYILVTGGGFLNKGAQSMTFIAIDEIKKRYPDMEVILLSDVAYKNYRSRTSPYDFKILPMNIGLNLELLGGPYKALWRTKAKKEHKNNVEAVVNELKDVFSKTAAIIDISGYTLSSQRGIGAQILYLYMIKLAKKYNIKVYLMPQSFGPFNYSSKHKKFFNYLMKKQLKYPEKIFARENEGYELLIKNYRLKNVERSYDLVLLNKGIDEENIYKDSKLEIKNYDDINGVGIVPNMRNFDHGNKNEILNLYKNMIHTLLEKGKKVYLIRHSHEDLEACVLIKKNFEDNNDVILMTEDMSCLNFDSLVKKFDFLIASRFHSIVHAYKNGIPCIALGWATKYHELLKIFKQERYIFDVRDINGWEKIESEVLYMIENREKEEAIILSTLTDVQRKNVFDYLKI